MEREHSFNPEVKPSAAEHKEKLKRIVRAAVVGMALSFPGAEALAQHTHQDKKPHEHKPVPAKVTPRPNKLMERQPSKSESQAKTQVSKTTEQANTPETQGQIIEQAFEKAAEQLQNSEDGTNVVEITDPAVTAALKTSIDRALKESKNGENWMSVATEEPTAPDPDPEDEHEHEHDEHGAKHGHGTPFLITKPQQRFSPQDGYRVNLDQVKFHGAVTTPGGTIEIGAEKLGAEEGHTEIGYIAPKFAIKSPGTFAVGPGAQVKVTPDGKLDSVAMTFNFSSLGGKLEGQAGIQLTQKKEHDIGVAKFLAVPSEMEIEGQKLFEESAIWQEIVIGLSHLRVGEEVETREVLEQFDHPQSASLEIKDLSLYALTPRKHVKIYQVNTPIDIQQTIELKSPYQICYRNVNPNSSVILLITSELAKPKWSRIDQLLDIKYDLLVIFYDRQNQLLFINSSRSADGLYESIAKALAPGAKGLPISLVNKVLKDLSNTNFFNIGMRNRLQNNNAESYKIISGPSAQATVKESDARFYSQGHVYGTAEELGKKVNIGFSSGSKVWSSSSLQIPQLIRWCKELGRKIRSRGGVRTNSSLDSIPVGIVVDTIPQGIIYADWDKEAYDYINPIEAVYVTAQGVEITCHISDLDLNIDYERSDTNAIYINIMGEGISYPVKFTLESFFQPANNDPDTIRLKRGESESNLMEFLSDYYVHFYTADGSVFFGNELIGEPSRDFHFNTDQIEGVDWRGVDIQNECNADTERGISIQNFIKNRLIQTTQNKIVYFDHGTGEIADFVAIKETRNVHVFEFYHCKGSAEAQAGARVKDIYEVCGQAQKSLKWTNSLNKLYNRIIHRYKPEKFVKGTLEEFKEVVNRAKTTRIIYKVFIVQPGLSCSQINDTLSECLAATSDHVTVGGCEFKVLAST